MLHQLKWIMIALLLFAGVALAAPSKADSGPQLTIGMVTDIQYCDCTDKLYQDGSHRFYKTAPEKLEQAIDTFNHAHPDFVVNLGDTIEKNETSFNTITPILNKIKSKQYHILGNHDFPKFDNRAMKHLKMKHRYYNFSSKGYRFVFLDTNEISTFANPPESIEYQTARKWSAQLKEHHQPYALSHNGGVSEKQLRWLDHTLFEAKKKKEKVIIFGHQSVYPKYDDNILNRDDVIEIMERYKNVVAYFNGHTHPGKYSQLDGVHYVNLKAMVDTADSNAYSIVKVFKNEIKIKGYGREPSRTLKLKEIYKAASDR